MQASASGRGEFWDNMKKVSAPIQMMKRGLGEALWREKEIFALAWVDETLPTLRRPLTSDAWLGDGRKKPWSFFEYYLDYFARLK